MQVCSECQHENPNDVHICENCQTPLDEKDFAFQTIMIRPAAFEEVAQKEKVQTNPQEDELVLEIEGTILTRPLTKQFILGRKAPDSAGSLFNLTSFDAYGKGVSRNHAQVQLNNDEFLEITDLGSANGTFINGQKLESLQPYLLHDGDEIRIADLCMNIYYQEP